MKRRILGLAVVAVVLISTAAFAQKTDTKKEKEDRSEMQMLRNRDMKPQGERVQFFTEEQQEAIKKIRLESDKEIKPLQNKLNELEARQQTLATADKADMNAIYKNIDEMGNVKTDIAKIHAKQRQDVRKLLTEEQLAKFDKLGERRFDSKRERPGADHMNRPERPNRDRFEKGE